MPAANRLENLPGHEILLADYAQRLARHTTGRRAVRIHLSRLRPYHRREHHIRIAMSTCESLCKNFEGQIFLLSTCDIVVVVKGASVAEIDRSIIKLRFLFSEDPLATEESDDKERTFCTWYEMETGYAAFAQMAEQAVRDFELHRTHQAALEPLVPGNSFAKPKTPLDPARLGRLEQQLASTDLLPFIRRQLVAAVLPNMPARPLMNELYVSIPDLAHRIVPDVEITVDRWLFRHLTLTLDQRVLALLPQIETTVSYATSINLNVASILSPQFLTFDTRLRLLTQKTIVLELQAIDIFSDLGAFMFARDFARDRGYRVCLDGLNHLTFPLLQRDDLSFDLYKILWSMDIEQEVQERHRDAFERSVARAGAARVILCHCDSSRAVSFGHDIGISMFQGRYIDTLVAPLVLSPVATHANT